MIDIENGVKAIFSPNTPTEVRKMFFQWASARWNGGLAYKIHATIREQIVDKINLQTAKELVQAGKNADHFAGGFWDKLYELRPALALYMDASIDFTENEDLLPDFIKTSFDDEALQWVQHEI